MKKFLSYIIAGLSVLTGFNAHAEENNMTSTKTLVAYFSATGTTAKVAENLAKSISIEAAELLEHFQWQKEYDEGEVADELDSVKG